MHLILRYCPDLDGRANDIPYTLREYRPNRSRNETSDVLIDPVDAKSSSNGFPRASWTDCGRNIFAHQILIGPTFRWHNQSWT